MLAVALLGCAPSLQHGDWAIGWGLPGEDLVEQPFECELVLHLGDGGEVDWLTTCGREDLPAGIELSAVWASARAYALVGGGSWVTRNGTHPGLEELWVYPDDEVTDPQDYAGAIAVLWLSRVEQ